MLTNILNFINGASVPSQSTRTSLVYNPVTGEYLGAIGLASARDVQAAVVAARKAFLGWANTPLVPRARILERLLRIVMPTMG